MKRIFYAGGSVVTGDRTADAVLRYAQALAQREASDIIDIPIFAAGGISGRAQLLVGPASQLLIATEIPRHSEFDDDVFLQTIEDKMEWLLRSKGQPIDADDFGGEEEGTAD
ncbi:hypothetical protein [Marisediminicola antarctica]|uniref:Uncharacterized protein n=1 Tax=Marisediminicola antarctica TaxID=674079 RepID=A0A7L5AHJ5_9MICO|nr:hypothetical protein [Marisediminicola antarctica]QHO69777.1 hypothetical protein BHD05_09120 [Marisediminicola antarctica]